MTPMNWNLYKQMEEKYSLPVGYLRGIYLLGYQAASADIAQFAKQRGDAETSISNRDLNSEKENINKVQG
jgi:hypothetical protein